MWEEASWKHRVNEIRKRMKGGVDELHFFEGKWEMWEEASWKHRVNEIHKKMKGGADKLHFWKENG